MDVEFKWNFPIWIDNTLPKMYGISNKTPMLSMRNCVLSSLLGLSKRLIKHSRLLLLPLVAFQNWKVSPYCWRCYGFWTQDTAELDLF